jgi:hypothetical protein
MFHLIDTLRPNHWVVTEYTKRGERVVFGAWLPLSKRAAIQYIKGLGDPARHRVVMRKTAQAKGILG